MGNDMWGTGEGGGGGKERYKQHENTCFFIFFGLFCSLLGVFCTET